MGRGLRFGNKVPGDYEMNPRVTRRTQPGYGLRDSLLDLPTVSVVLPVDHLFGAKTDIYAHILRCVGWIGNVPSPWSGFSQRAERVSR